MPALFDSFPDELKNIFTSNSLDVGSVIRVHVKDTIPPKVKRFIIVGQSSDKITVASVFINTDINQNVLNTPELQSCQVALDNSNRSYLDHDSFVDCSQVYERSYEELKSALENNPNCNIGKVSEDDLNTIQKTVKEAKTVAPMIKEKYGLN